FPRPVPLVRALTAVGLVLLVFAGLSAIIATGADVDRAFRPDADRFGPDSVVGGGSARRPVGSGRVGPGRGTEPPPTAYWIGSDQTESGWTARTTWTGPTSSRGIDPENTSLLSPESVLRNRFFHSLLLPQMPREEVRHLATPGLVG